MGLSILYAAVLLLMSSGCGAKDKYTRQAELQTMQNAINNPNTPPAAKAELEQQYAALSSTPAGRSAAAGPVLPNGAPVASAVAGKSTGMP